MTLAEQMAQLAKDIRALRLREENLLERFSPS